MNQRFLEIFNEISSKPRPTDKDERVLLIDGLNTFFRVSSVMPIISERGEFVGGLVGFMRSIALNIREFNPTRCIIVFDGKGGSSTRRKIYPEYKGNRKMSFSARTIGDYEFTAEDMEQSFKWQLTRLLKYLDCLPIQLLSLENIEADDTIAYIATQIYQNTDNKIRIISTDRDYLQLVSDKIEVWSPVKKKLYTPEKIIEEFDIHPNNYLLHRCFTGDSSDNIPGVKGVALKTLSKLFDLKTKEINLSECFEICRKNLNLKKKIHKVILDSEYILERNLKLMSLQDPEIPGHLKLDISRKIHEDIPKIDKYSFKQLIIEDNLETEFKNLDTWFYSFNSLAIWATR